MPKDHIEFYIDESLFEGANYQAILGNSAFYYVRKTNFYRQKFRILEANLAGNYTLSIYLLVLQFLKTLAANLRFLVRRLSFLKKNIGTVVPRNKNLEFDYIFIDHSFGSSAEKDSYYGNIPRLVSNNKKVLVASIDHSPTWLSGYYWPQLDLVNESLANIVLPTAMPLKFFMKRQFHKMKNLLRYKFWPSFWGGQILGILNLFGSDALFDDCFTFYFRQLIDQCRDDVVVVITYEGYGWERRACHLLHSEKPRGRVVGYHHVHYRDDLVAVNYRLPKDSQPDLILVTNQKAYKQFKESHAVPVENVGSVRYQNDFNKKSSTSERASQVTLLLIPEGFVSEETIFLDFIGKFAKALGHITFIYRPHPSRRSFAPILKARLKMLGLPNCSISTGDLGEDIINSDLVVYRGSMAVFEALTFQKNVAYLSSGDEIIDALHGLSHKRVSMSDSIDAMNSFLLCCKNNVVLDFPQDISLEVKMICDPFNESLFLNLLESVEVKAD